MSYDEYWNGTPMLAKYYREAFLLKQKRNYEEENNSAWLNGMYIQNAVYTSVVYALNPKEAKKYDIKYIEKPIELYTDEKEKEKLKDQETKREREKSAEWIMQLYKITNAKFPKNKAVKTNGKQ